MPVLIDRPQEIAHEDAVEFSRRAGPELTANTFPTQSRVAKLSSLQELPDLFKTRAQIFADEKLHLSPNNLEKISDKLERHCGCKVFITGEHESQDDGGLPGIMHDGVEVLLGKLGDILSLDTGERCLLVTLNAERTQQRVFEFTGQHGRRCHCNECTHTLASSGDEILAALTEIPEIARAAEKEWAEKQVELLRRCMLGLQGRYADCNERFEQVMAFLPPRARMWEEVAAIQRQLDELHAVTALVQAAYLQGKTKQERNFQDDNEKKQKAELLVADDLIRLNQAQVEKAFEKLEDAVVAWLEPQERLTHALAGRLPSAQQEMSWSMITTELEMSGAPLASYASDFDTFNREIERVVTVIAPLSLELAAVEYEASLRNLDYNLNLRRELVLQDEKVSSES